MTQRSPHPTRTPSTRTRGQRAARAAALLATLSLPLALLAPAAGASASRAAAPAADSAPEGPRLRDVTDKPVGTAVREEVLRRTDDIGARYRQTLAEEFSMVVPESELKFNRLRPRAGAEPARPVAADYNLTLPQPILDAAAANGQEVRGHTLVWYRTNPAWILNTAYTGDQLLEIMRGHIAFTTRRYADRIDTWDVVNEALDADGTLREPCNPDAPAAGAECGRSGALSKASVWQRIGGSEDYTHIIEAFRAARKNLPASAKLYYNDFGIERSGPKADGALDLVKRLLAETGETSDGQTRPLVDGIGFQAHLGVDWTPAYVADFRANMKRFTDLGLETQITELDVGVDLPVTPAKLEVQKRVFHDIGRMCAEEEACTAILLWGFSDRFQWIGEGWPGQYGAATVFDEEFAAKPGYFGFRDGLTLPTPLLTASTGRR
ncbi:endo-1,4-beta-xylanase [Streptomyces sp. NPDC058576]|uniref:endo-1,4-beta-xylanase n=1 Tax=Streptomyces sp. NPDC058576 TaxID=3346547 RepID=UPI003646B35E